MDDQRTMTEGEARAALVMYRLALKLVRVVLSGWDYQGKKAREQLILAIDTIERELEKMLAAPEGDGSNLAASVKYLAEQVAILESRVAAA